MKKIKKLIVTGLGTGYLPLAPGSWGSLAVSVIFLGVVWGSPGHWYCVSGTMLLLSAAAAIACVLLGPFCERTYGKKDPGPCTIDEWAGQGLTYLLLPLSGGYRAWLTVAALGFVVFRIFDIVKPPPARRLEKLPAGWGILLDDLVAAVYANLTCQLILRLWLLKGV